MSDPEAQQPATPQRDRAWKPVFLNALRKTGNITAAAKLAGKDRVTAYRARKRSETFARQWDEALEEAIDLLEVEARRRAQTGVDEPVFHKGDVVGHVTKYSDNLLIFLLKAHRPEKYRERTTTRHEGEIGLRTLAEVAREVAQEGEGQA